MIANFKNCREILKNDFSKENNINKLTQYKVVLIDSYNYTFRFDEFGLTKEAIDRGFITPLVDIGGTGFLPSDKFLGVNINNAIKEINNRLDYLYLQDDLFREQIKFLNNLKTQFNDLEHAKEKINDYEPEDKAITLEYIGRNVSAELANIMFLCGYSYKVYFEQENLEDYKKQMIDTLNEDKDIDEICKNLNITYDELIEKIQNARLNLENINTNDPIFRVKDLYCKFIEKPKDSNVDLIDVLIKQNDKFIKVTNLNVSKDYNIVQIKQLAKDFLCGVVGNVLDNGSIQKEFCGQGWIYKNFENFYKREGICYVSEYDKGNIAEAGVSFNDICEEVKSYLKNCDVDLSKLPENTVESLAEDVFVTVDWQFTSSLIFGDDYLEGYVEDFPEEYFVNKDKEPENE